MKKSYFLIMIVLGFCSCKKESSHEVLSTQVDVYVAGFVADSNYYDDQSGEPIYWKNGSPVKLEFNIGYFGSGARPLSIAVSGNDVYVGGVEVGQGPRGEYADYKFWKNGILMDVESRSSYPNGPIGLTSLVVSNNDVYMAGYVSIVGTGETAFYYKNGSPIDLPDGSAGSTATSIAVSGNDVYVAGVSYNGSILNGSQNGTAKYWKNANEVKLTDGSKDVWTTSIAVSGTDVYVAGIEWDGIPDANGLRHPSAEYWKNGIPVNLTDGLSESEANSIAVSGTDVYVAGTQWDGIHDASGYRSKPSIAKYWKNGNPVNLTDGTEDAEAESIAVLGSDVYVAGFESDGTNYIAKYWKNGIPVILGNASNYPGDAEAYSIFLVKK